MSTLHRVQLTADDRASLIAMTRRGASNARRITRARVLLLADRGTTDRAIADALDLHPRTCQRLRQRACQEGIQAALDDRPRPGAARLLDDRQEAHLIALACSDAPDGRDRWTMRLLADKLVELEVVRPISDETVRRSLKNAI